MSGDPAVARADAVAILRAAIDAADPRTLVTRAIERAPELQYATRIHIVSVGKAAVPMATAAHGMLAERVVSGIVVTPRGIDAALPAPMRMLHGAHPIPDATSVHAADAVEELLVATEAEDLVLVLLSGGASALIAAPRPELSVAEYAHCVALLLSRGADIHALNTVRIHLDRLKGGRLAARAAPARVLGLVLSDVVGDPLDMIASGPLSPTATRAADAAAVLRDYALWDSCGAGVHAALQCDDVPSPKDRVFDKVRLKLIGNNALAVRGAVAHAEQLGYAVDVLAEPIIGEARAAGERLAHIALEHVARAPLCILAGGETTVTVRGAGTGGRNQELVLAGALALGTHTGIVIGSIGTDGIDGPTDAAGAIADGATIAQAPAAARAALDANDSYTFFRNTGGLMITGPTGTNVMDVQLVLVTGSS